MQAVCILVFKILSMTVAHRVEAREGVKINYRYSPDVCRFFHRFNVCVNIFSAAVFVIFCTLPVLLVSIEPAAVYRGKQYYLFCWEHPLKGVHGNVNSAAVCVVVHYGYSLDAVFHALIVAMAVFHCCHLLLKPVTDGYGVVVVISANENHYGIKVISVLVFQFVGRARNVIPLPAANAINKWSDVKPLV